MRSESGTGWGPYLGEKNLRYFWAAALPGRVRGPAEGDQTLRGLSTAWRSSTPTPWKPGQGRNKRSQNGVGSEEKTAADAPLGHMKKEKPPEGPKEWWVQQGATRQCPPH